MVIRIDRPGQNHAFELGTQSLSEKRNGDFSNILAQTSRLQGKELELFLNRLDSQGKKLAESMSVQDLIDFKNMVKEFLKNTLGKSRTMQEETFWDCHGQPRAMSRVVKIDKALEELGEQVLSSQAEPLKILAKIDEIKGLIIDLFA